MQHTSSALITEIQPKIHSNPSEEIDKLTMLKNDILQKMETIDALNLTFKEKSQTSFLKTFQKIMNDLSEQLKHAVEAYQNIDQQIQTDPKCILLSQKAHFYKNQRQTLEQQYQQELYKLNQVKLKNQLLKQKRNKLRAKSVLSQQKLVKYFDRNNTLTVRFGHLIDSQQKNQTNYKKITESTKYHTSADKTRIPSINSVNRKFCFSEIQDDKSSKRKNSINRNTFTKVFTSQNVSPFRLNNFF